MNDLIKQAVKRQLVSDVPVGVYLSGAWIPPRSYKKCNELGIPEINTFTMGFNEPTDESPRCPTDRRHTFTRIIIR